MNGLAVPTAEVTAYPGALASLTEVLDELGATRPFVVASPGARRRAELDLLLAGRAVAWYGEISLNPTLEAALAARRAFEKAGADAVVAVGGGSTLDTAKLARALPASQVAARAVLAGRRPALPPPRLVAVPTTAGTGSEVTPFATVYVDGEKHSLDGPEATATRAIVDPDLLATCPDDVAAASALDATAHAVESYWSKRSTPVSRKLAAGALAELVAVLEAGVPLEDAAVRGRAANAATMAGLAIGLTRTTTAHAFAYPTTVRFGVPHGLACAVHLSWLLPHVWRTVDSRCSDPRGVAFVRRRLDELADLLGATDAGHAGCRLRRLIEASGLRSTLAANGVPPEAAASLVHNGCRHGRAANLPVDLDPDTACEALIEAEAVAWTAT